MYLFDKDSTGTNPKTTTRNQIHNFLKGQVFDRYSRSSQSVRSAHERMNISPEELIHEMMTSQPVEEADQLVLRPHFFTLSTLQQTKFLFFIRKTHNSTSTHTFQKFIKTIEQSITKDSNYWVSYELTQLKKSMTTDNDNKLNESNSKGDDSQPHYVFTSESKDLKETVIKKLQRFNKTMHSPDVGVDNTKNSNISTLLKAGGKTDLCTNKPDGHADDLISSKETIHRLATRNDVIVIEVDLDSNSSQEEQVQFETKTSSEVNTFRNTKESKSSNIKTNDSTDDDCIIVLSDSDGPADNPNDREVKSIVEHRKRSRFKDDENEEESLARVDSEDEIESTNPEREVKRRKVEVTSSMENHLEELQSRSEQCGDQGEYEEKQVTPLECQLSSIKEMMSLESNSQQFVTAFWEALSNVEHNQLNEACGFLNVSHLPEDVLLSLCDALSTLNLSHQVEVSFLHAALYVKVSSLTERASHTLLNILFSVMKHNARTAIEIMCSCLEDSKAGEPQSQIMLSLCKGSFPSACLPLFIRQLSSRAIPINVHLTSALQLLVSKASDLDRESLHLLVSHLYKHQQSISDSSPFGKLLLTIITKHKAKIMGELKDIMAKMVNQHQTGLKKTLIKKLDG